MALTPEPKRQILNADDLYRIMQQVLLRAQKIDRGKEHLWVVAMANNYRVLRIELVGLGSPRALTVEPVDVFSFALQKQAVKIILVHNHPSGELFPSAADIDTTSRMVSVGKLVLCEVIDHLIISETSFYSFKEQGVLGHISQTGVDLTFQEVEEAKRMQREQAAKHKNEKEETARKLLVRGMSAAEVAEITGLTRQKIAALVKSLQKAE